jgi:hypothetical protein
MNTRIAVCTAVFLCALGAYAFDMGVSVRAGGGVAMAFGASVGASAAEFGAAMGAEAVLAPITAVSFGAGADFRLTGALRADAVLDIRRLGYAFWAADAGASMWMSLWTLDARLGARYDPGLWYAGAGAIASVPISGLNQTSGQGGAGMAIASSASSAQPFFAGAYLEGGVALPRAYRAGSVFLQPFASLELCAWPTGIQQGVQNWQASCTLLVSVSIQKKAVR